jgi:flagellar basal body-associated protein FliL
LSREVKRRNPTREADVNILWIILIIILVLAVLGFFSRGRW